MWTGLLADVRRAVSRLRRDVGFAVVVTATLATGIGSTAAVFGMVNRLVLRPVDGVADPDRVAFLVLDPDRRGRGLTLQSFDALREGVTTVQAMASYGSGTYPVGGPDGRVIEVRSMSVYGDFFEALGVRALAGRLLRGEETGPGADPRVAVLSAGLAGRLFGIAADAVGRTVTVNGESVAVVGVTEEGFRGPDKRLPVDMWVPHAALVPLAGFPPSALRSARSGMHVNIVLRFAEGVGAGAVQDEVRAVLERIGRAYPSPDAYFDGMEPTVYAGLRIPFEEQARTLASLAMFGVFVGLILLIACANVGTLMLARNSSRRGEIATQRALGASSARIARHGLVESLVLAGLGSAGGLVFGWALTWLFRSERLTTAAVFGPLVLDWRLAVFACGAAVVTALLFGTWPALTAARFDLSRALREGESTASGSGRLVRTQRLASTGQVALSLALLVCALLMARSVTKLFSVDTGVSTEDVWTMPVGSPGLMDYASQIALYRDLVGRVRSLSGIEQASLDHGGASSGGVAGRVGLPGTSRGAAIRTAVRSVSPGWMEMLDVRMLAGRTLAGSDWEARTPVPVLLTRALALTLFGTVDVDGRTLRVGVRDMEDAVVIGVTDDLRDLDSLDEPVEAVFVPIGRMPVPTVTLVVRARRMDTELADRLRDAADGLFASGVAGVPVAVSPRIRAAFSEQRVFRRLTGLMAALAVVLTCVGLYGLMMLRLAERKREFGVRLALGAPIRAIARLVVADVASVLALGSAIGLAGACLLALFLQSRLFGVGALDPLAYVGAVVLLSIGVGTACLRPIIVASRISPVRALKSD
ncbi:MAG: ABC transporter permease [Gemmatimonadota bacterium]